MLLIKSPPPHIVIVTQISWTKLTDRKKREKTGLNWRSVYFEAPFELKIEKAFKKTQFCVYVGEKQYWILVPANSDEELPSSFMVDSRSGVQ